MCLRLVGGGLMLSHGIPKLIKMVDGDLSFPDPLGMGPTTSLLLTVFAEVVCSFLLLVGFKTKWVAVPLAITMAVAGFVVHGSDPLKDKEMALLYLAIYVALAFMGGGKYAVKK